MHVLGQTLTPDLKTQVFGEATTFRDEWLKCETRGKEGTWNSPPDWEPSSSHNRATRPDVFLKVLKQACTKALNYAKLADIEQKKKEAPGKFLDRPWEVLCRFTDIDPESTEGRMIL